MYNKQLLQIMKSITQRNSPGQNVQTQNFSKKGLKCKKQPSTLRITADKNKTKYIRKRDSFKIDLTNRQKQFLNQILPHNYKFKNVQRSNHQLYLLNTDKLNQFQSISSKYQSLTHIDYQDKKTTISQSIFKPLQKWKAKDKDSIENQNQKLNRISLTLLDELMNCESSILFREPINPYTSGLTDYWKIIKKPINLSWMISKVKANSYKNFKEIDIDIKLMIDNSYLYNKNNSRIKQQTNIFQTEYEQIKLTFKSEIQSLNDIQLELEQNNQSKSDLKNQSKSEIGQKDINKNKEIVHQERLQKSVSQKSEGSSSIGKKRGRRPKDFQKKQQNQLNENQNEKIDTSKNTRSSKPKKQSENKKQTREKIKKSLLKQIQKKKEIKQIQKKKQQDQNARLERLADQMKKMPKQNLKQMKKIIKNSQENQTNQSIDLKHLQVKTIELLQTFISEKLKLKEVPSDLIKRQAQSKELKQTKKKFLSPKRNDKIFEENEVESDPEVDDD